MSWLRMHVAFGRIALGAGANPQTDQSTSAAAQMGTVADALGGAKADEKVTAYFERFWAEQTRTRELKSQAELFMRLATVHKVYLMSKARDEAKVDVSTVKRAYRLFLQKTSDSLVAEFVRDAEKGFAIWQEVLKDSFRLVQDQELRPFRHQVERRLIDAYIQRAVAALRKEMTGISQSKLSAHVDDMRHIVRDYSQKFLLIAVGAVDAWDVPLVPPDRWPTILATGTEISGFVSGALLLPLAAVPPAGIIIVAAVVLLAAEKAGTLYVAWSDLKDKEEQYRQAVASRSAKEQLRTGYEQTSHVIENQQDLLAMIYTVGAIKAGLDFNTEAQEPLRTYVWQQLFKDLSQDPTAARHKLMQDLESSFRQQLLGS